MISPLNVKGFTLVEILITLVIITIALVAILGMFPIAIEAAGDSTTETRITGIAQSIMADLSSGEFTNTFIVNGPDAESNVLTVNLDNPSPDTYYIAYKESGEALKELTEAEFTNGYRGGAWFLAKIVVQANTPSTNVALISAYVHSPAHLSIDRPLRKSYSFVHYISE